MLTAQEAFVQAQILCPQVVPLYDGLQTCAARQLRDHGSDLCSILLAFVFTGRDDNEGHRFVSVWHPADDQEC